MPAALSAVCRNSGSPGLALFTGTPAGRHSGVPALDRLSRRNRLIESDRELDRDDYQFSLYLWLCKWLI